MEQTENIQTPISPVDNVQNQHFTTKKLLIGIVLVLVLAVVFVLGMGYESKNNRVGIVEKPPIKTVETTTNDMAGWKTFTNSEYGISFKYPQTWTIKNEATLITDTGDMFWVFNSVTDSSWLSLCDSLLSEQSISVGTLSATKAIKSNMGSCDPGPDFVEYISTKITFENKYGVIFSYKRDDQKESDIILDNILTTFKFNEKTSETQSVQTKMGYIKDIDQQNEPFYMSFDEIKWFSGDEAEKVAREETNCTSGCAPSGFYISNLDKTVIAYKISKNVLTSTGYSDENKKIVSLGDFISRYKDDFVYIPFNITIKNDEVTEISEIYVP